MAERLRALLDRPLDPSVSRAMMVLALAASIGLAAVSLVDGLGDHTVEGGRSRHEAPRREAAVDRAWAVAAASLSEVAGQDRQDRPGTGLHRRALREVDAHRALQHVPFRAGGTSIELVGASRGRAVLWVEAPTLGAARRGWRGFLRRFHDPGSSYLPRFEEGRNRG